MGALWSRPLGSVLVLFANALGIAPNAVAQLYEDNHPALVRNGFRRQDASTKYSFGRCSTLVAVSGWAKSVALKQVQEVLQSEEVSRAFGLARGAWCHQLGQYK